MGRTETVVEALTLTSASLSLVGCSFIIFSYFYFTKLQMFPFKLICILSITELIVSVLLFVRDDALCWVRGALADYFELASMMWISIIAFNVWQVLCVGNRRADRLELKYHLVGWGVPLLLWIPPAAANKFGDAGLWCWIPPKDRLFRWLFYYGPWAVVILLNLAIYFRVSSSLSSSQKHSLSTVPFAEPSATTQGILNERQEQLVVMRLRLYILVFLWVSFWSFAHRFDELIFPSHDNNLTVWAVMHAVFRPLMGAMNSVVYGLNRRLVNEYKVLFLTSSLYRWYSGRDAQSLQKDTLGSSAM